MKNQKVSAFLYASTVCRCSHHYIINRLNSEHAEKLYCIIWFLILCTVVQFDLESKIRNIPTLLYGSYKYAVVYSGWLYLSQAPALNSTGEHSFVWQDRERLILLYSCLHLVISVIAQSNNVLFGWNPTSTSWRPPSSFDNVSEKQVMYRHGEYPCWRSNNIPAQDEL